MKCIKNKQMKGFLLAISLTLSFFIEAIAVEPIATSQDIYLPSNTSSSPISIPVSIEDLSNYVSITDAEDGDLTPILETDVSDFEVSEGGGIYSFRSLRTQGLPLVWSATDSEGNRVEITNLLKVTTNRNPWILLIREDNIPQPMVTYDNWRIIVSLGDSVDRPENMQFRLQIGTTPGGNDLYDEPVDSTIINLPNLAPDPEGLSEVFLTVLNEIPDGVLNPIYQSTRTY